MQCAKGAPGPGDCEVGAGKAGGACPHGFPALTADCHATGLSSKSHLPNSPSPTPEVGSEGEGHGVSLLLLGYVQFSGPKPLSPHS